MSCIPGQALAERKAPREEAAEEHGRSYPLGATIVPDGASHSVALSAGIMQERHFVHWILNAYWEPLDFELPEVSGEHGGSWRRWIDTGLDSPDDIVAWQEAPLFSGRTYRLGPHSVAVLYAPVGSSCSEDVMPPDEGRRVLGA